MGEETLFFSDYVEFVSCGMRKWLARWGDGCYSCSHIHSIVSLAGQRHEKL